MDFNELVDLYINEIESSDDFKRLVELKNIINNDYKKELISFKTLESNYLEASKNKDYYSNFNQIKTDFINAKAKLYSHEEVKEYFDLERKINDYINKDIDEIKSSISNKFKSSNMFEICNQKK
jgi:cell fate (sporulation/competence/biofilm development) regulator YlbF (YheA/YmcA/DUF963 family)